MLRWRWPEVGTGSSTCRQRQVTVDHAAHKLVTVIEEVSRLPLDALRPGPLDRG